MPRIVPLATMAINNSINAACLLREYWRQTIWLSFARLEKYAMDMEIGVVGKARILESVGFEHF
jgi:phosphoribosylaminoimidazole carboxylase